MSEEASQTENNATLASCEESSAEISAITADTDKQLVDLLRSGNERAFVMLVERYSPSMLRIASTYVATQAVAEEVVQDTWLGVLKGLNSFEGRSSLKTWIFRILTNQAKTRAQREGRSIPFSSLTGLETDIYEPAVDPDRFQSEDQRAPGHWRSFPSDWHNLPEDHLLSQETRTCIQTAIASLSPHQCEVITLRDIEGWTSNEVCSCLNISEENQRVLLHRARSRVRRALEKYFDGGQV